MDNDSPLETACAHPPHQAPGYRRDGGVRYAQPEDIGFQSGAVKGGRNNDLVQRNSGYTKSVRQRTAPIPWSDDGNAALQIPSPRAPRRTDDRMVL